MPPNPDYPSNYPVPSHANGFVTRQVGTLGSLDRPVRVAIIGAGPSGLIGSNRADAILTVQTMVEDRVSALSRARP